MTEHLFTMDTRVSGGIMRYLMNREIGIRSIPTYSEWQVGDIVVGKPASGMFNGRSVMIVEAPREEAHGQWMFVVQLCVDSTATPGIKLKAGGRVTRNCFDFHPPAGNAWDYRG